MLLITEDNPIESSAVTPNMLNKLANRMFQAWLGGNSGEIFLYWKIQRFSREESAPDNEFNPPIKTVYFGGPFFTGWYWK